MYCPIFTWNTLHCLSLMCVITLQSSEGLAFLTQYLYVYYTDTLVLTIRFRQHSVDSMISFLLQSEELCGIFQI